MKYMRRRASHCLPRLVQLMMFRIQRVPPLSSTRRQYKYYLLYRYCYRIRTALLLHWQIAWWWLLVVGGGWWRVVDSVGGGWCGGTWAVAGGGGYTCLSAPVIKSYRYDIDERTYDYRRYKLTAFTIRMEWTLSSLFCPHVSSSF